MSFVPVYVEGVFVGIIAAIIFLVIQNVLQLYSIDAVKSVNGVLGLSGVVFVTVLVVSGPFTALLFADVGQVMSGVLLAVSALFVFVIGRIIVTEARDGEFDSVFEDGDTSED